MKKLESNKTHGFGRVNDMTSWSRDGNIVTKETSHDLYPVFGVATESVKVSVNAGSPFARICSYHYPKSEDLCKEACGDNQALVQNSVEGMVPFYVGDAWHKNKHT